MKKRAKKAASKKSTKAAAKKPSRPAAKAARRKSSPAVRKTAPSQPAARSGAGTYTPQPIEGMGWAPFRYPLQ